MNKIIYEKIYPSDYEELTKIMTSAFDKDTTMHTDMKEGGPTGYNDGSLIKKLNDNENFESYKIIYEGNTVGAYSIGFNHAKEYSLEMLFIDPDCKGHHLGTLVWKDIEEKYLTAKRWTVETPDYSLKNHHFYTKNCGFTFLKQNICNNGAYSFVFIKEKE